MKIRFNRGFSATIAMVLVVTLANGNYVPQNPVANIQSSPAKLSSRMSSNKLNFPVSHIEASENSTTFTTTETTLVTSPASTTTVTSTSTDTTATTTTEVSEPANNATATSFEGTAAMAATQSATTSNVGTAIETQTDENGFLVDKYVINPSIIYQPGKCPKGYTTTTNGECKPIYYGRGLME